jgi:hypothetical protein
MKDLQANDKGHDKEGYCNSPNKLCRLRPSLCMVDNANENKECQRHHIEQREQTFVVYFGEDEHEVILVLYSKRSCRSILRIFVPGRVNYIKKTFDFHMTSYM